MVNGDLLVGSLSYSPWAGNIVPDADMTYDVGSSSLVWGDNLAAKIPVPNLVLNENLLKHLNRPKINLSPKRDPSSSLSRGIASFKNKSDDLNLVMGTAAETVSEGDICLVNISGQSFKYRPTQVNYTYDAQRNMSIDIKGIVVEHS